MNRLEKLYEVTIELKNLLDQPITPKNREEIINKITVLIEKRGEQMDKVSPPFTKEENEYGKKVIILNQHIQSKMNQLFAELKLEMKNMKKQKKSNRTYTNPYQDVQVMDGMFLDSKQ